MLNLERPLAFSDLETTGINTGTDRIVEIAILKVFPGGESESYVRRVNPTIPIPYGASKVHGIYDKDVAGEPTFSMMVTEIRTLLEGCDLAGFNSNLFDIPLLAEEFLRAGHDFDMTGRKMVDVQGIFHKMERRNLGAAYKFYCGKDLSEAHQAEADVRATYEVMLAQVERYPELKNDISFLHEFTANENIVDLAGKLYRNEKGAEAFSFGKYKGKAVSEVFRGDPSYYDWIMKQDFPLQTKKVLQGLKEKYSA